MGKRYFCDYCDRSFQDNLHNRKKHLNGLQHLKAKKVWYDMFRDAAAILLDEQNKRPCRKFLLTGLILSFLAAKAERKTVKIHEVPWGEVYLENQGDLVERPCPSVTVRITELSPAGQCDFGSNCRFSHMSERDLQELSIRVEEERRAREWPLDPPDLPEGHLEDWLEKRAKRLSSAPSSRAEPTRATVFQYPLGWPPVQELPPSLRAPPPGGWPLQPGVQWG